MPEPKFAVLVPSDRHAEHWLAEYGPMFQMLGGTFFRSLRLWKMPFGEVRVYVIRGRRDVDKLRGQIFCGFAREDVWDPEAIEAIKALVRERPEPRSGNLGTTLRPPAPSQGRRVQRGPTLEEMDMV